MEFLELAKWRCAIRKFSEKKLTDEQVRLILEAGRIAPTAANLQPQRVIAIRSEEGLQKLKLAGSVYNAPLALVVCADRSESWKRPLDGRDTADIDASIVATHMMLEAADLGLDSIWVCYFKADVIRREFALPEPVEPISILGIGYAAMARKSPDRFGTERKPLEETVRYETF